MGSYSSNPYRADAKAGDSIDRKREQERRQMLHAAFKNSEELATRLDRGDQFVEEMLKGGVDL